MNPSKASSAAGSTLRNSSEYLSNETVTALKTQLPFQWKYITAQCPNAEHELKGL